ncbi:Anti-sigma regulatory factor (Ser/Thr protein kinase) [Agreia bicolorata]|uniref:Anti-sigma regulatory factor (Ser/Thr protein kinase) n=1 Tax=Agreia bicolorata TaxID=110935 RepID=A0A1T4XY70_9MICO|nr:ATP-binding protein [Agreia bicolorata]SKA94519.1 Anti-sigma regulatory factor (Ser/Thr protein kinase) [Agreia bicolorata]
MTVVAESSLQLQPTALAMREIGGWLRSAIDHLDDTTAAALFPRAELAVHEACMNVIEHGQLPAGAVVDVNLVLDSTELTVWVRDSGTEFDLAAVTSPAPNTLQERGYGIKIIRSLVSELSYRRIGEQNELTLRIDFGGTQNAQ